MIFAGLIWLGALGMLNCQPVAGDRIVAADFARVLPEFAALPPDLVLGYSPMPGLRRIFHPDEIVRLASTHNLEARPSRGVCFSWKMQPLHPDEVMAVLQQSLGAPAAQLQITDLAPRIVPPGKLIFPRGTLAPVSPLKPEDPVQWRGYIQYSDTRRFPVTARVRLALNTTRVIALGPLKAGQPISGDMIREEPFTATSLTAALARTAAEVVGRSPRRTVAAGSAILQSELVAPMDIARGDRIDVEVRTGRAHLRLDARAESAGRAGDMIQVRNPSSGKLFMARVTGAGKALVATKGDN